MHYANRQLSIPNEYKCNVSLQHTNWFLQFFKVNTMNGTFAILCCIYSSPRFTFKLTLLPLMIEWYMPMCINFIIVHSMLHFTQDHYQFSNNSPYCCVLKLPYFSLLELDELNSIAYWIIRSSAWTFSWIFLF